MTYLTPKSGREKSIVSERSKWKGLGLYPSENSNWFISFWTKKTFGISKVKITYLTPKPGEEKSIEDDQCCF